MHGIMDSSGICEGEYRMNTINLKGKIPAPIRITGRLDIPVRYTVTFKDGDTVLQQVQVERGRTATYNSTVPAKDGNAFLGWVLSEPSGSIVDSDDVTAYQQINNVQEDITCWAVYSNKMIIHDSWAVISQLSQAGTAQNYYSIGYTKRIHLEGNMGVASYNRDIYVKILAFDHNSEIEGSGITFGCFARDSFGGNMCLTGSGYGEESRNGKKVFNMNHWRGNNYGGWAGSDLRYDILGSTDVAPSGYGSAPTSSRAGYDATETCATSPVANTLMSCLPSDLRAVMKPITKYTDNVGGDTYSESAVTETKDYLPLLSFFEVFGEDIANLNPYEKNNQMQYAYFTDDVYKYVSRDDYPNTFATWSLRSPASGHYGYYSFFSGGVTNGYSGTNITYGGEFATQALGIFPIFLV